jgi:predicted ArsR family transcriptional regulator
MDSFDRRILAVLKNGELWSSSNFFWEFGFSHNTVRLPIAKLKRQGEIVEEKKTRNGPGRPILTYSLPPESALDKKNRLNLVEFQITKHLSLIYAHPSEIPP